MLRRKLKISLTSFTLRAPFLYFGASASLFIQTRCQPLLHTPPISPSLLPIHCFPNFVNFDTLSLFSLLPKILFTNLLIVLMMALLFNFVMSVLAENCDTLQNACGTVMMLWILYVFSCFSSIILITPLTNDSHFIPLPLFSPILCLSISLLPSAHFIMADMAVVSKILCHE